MLQFLAAVERRGREIQFVCTQLSDYRDTRLVKANSKKYPAYSEWENRWIFSNFQVFWRLFLLPIFPMEPKIILGSNTLEVVSQFARALPCLVCTWI